MIVNKAYRYRIYPTTEQKITFAKTFGCVRFIYNKILSDRIDYYKETGQKLNNTPAQYKEEFPWLKEVDSLALAIALPLTQPVWHIALLPWEAEAIKQAKKTSDGAKHVHVCPAWDDKTMSCMLDKR